MTSHKLFGKDLTQFDEVDVDDLLTQLSPEELEILSKEVDPDVSINFLYLDGWLYRCPFALRTDSCRQTSARTIAASGKRRDH